MSKIICDVCGASYPDTAAQCPICGNAKSDAAAAMGTVGTPYDENYAYVKGGRFSHSNVRKMNSGKKDLPRTVAPAKPMKETETKSVQQPVVAEPSPMPRQEAPAPKPRQEMPVARSREDVPMAAPRRREREEYSDYKRKGTNIVLWIIIILLVVAILSVCGFFAFRLLDMYKPVDKPTQTNPTTTQSTPATTTTQLLPVYIPCEGITVTGPSSGPSAVINSVGGKVLLNAVPTPANTTDPVLFVSSNPNIASVDEDGVVTGLTNGYVTITITCGDYSTTYEITCRVGVEPTTPTTTPTTGPTTPTTTNRPTKPFIKLELNSADFTLDGNGNTHNLYSGELDPSAITWTSSNEKVATVQNGIVTAEGNGTATITAEFEGQRATAVVHCVNATKRGFTLNYTDITIKVGQSFVLIAYDMDGNRIDPSELKFSIHEDAEKYETKFLSVDETGKVTGLKYNIDWKEKYKIIYVEYQGETLKCIVRVTNP